MNKDLNISDFREGNRIEAKLAKGGLWYFSLIIRLNKKYSNILKLLRKTNVFRVGFYENKISKYWVF